MSSYGSTARAGAIKATRPRAQMRASTGPSVPSTVASAKSQPKPARTRAAAARTPQPRKAVPTRNLHQQPEHAPGLRASPRGMQEKLTLTKAQQADYKELSARRATYERQMDVYGRREAQLAARGDTEGAKFYRLMGGFAKSQLGVLAEYDRKHEALKSQRAALRAEADAKKTAQMLGGKPRKSLAAAGSALAKQRASRQAKRAPRKHPLTSTAYVNMTHMDN